MPRRLISLVVMLVVLLAGMSPAGAFVSAGQSAHACCRTMKAASHDGCPQATADAMRCCAPAPAPGSASQAPPTGVTTAHAPDFSLLKGHAAHVPGLPGVAEASVAHAFESARLKLPRDSIYLLNVVLLV